MLSTTTPLRWASGEQLDSNHGMQDTAALRQDTASLRAHINKARVQEVLQETTPINNNRLMAERLELRHM